MNFPSKEAKMLGQIKTRGWSVPVVERRPCAVNKEHDPPPQIRIFLLYAGCRDVPIPD